MFDLHVHSAPDLIPRLGDDLAIVDAYEAAGFRGCVLKSHFEPTVGRAAAAGRARSVRVYGGIVLNRSVGGLDVDAVRATVELGGRVVWMPTIDARQHRVSGLPVPARWQPAGDAISIDERALPALDAILEVIAAADVIVATGHLGPDECVTLVRRAREHGVRRILLTHPTYAVPALDADAVEALCDLGAVAEITAYQLYAGQSPERLAALAARLGPARCVLSSDAGQPDNPAPPEALAMLVERLVLAGLDGGAAAAMASETPEKLVVP